MVLYFSATGNCKFVAEKIATETSDKAISILDIDGAITLQQGENLGIVTATHFWGLPAIVEEFLQKLVITRGGQNYVFCVATYGSTCGQVDYFVNKILQSKGIALCASFGIKTVDNWTVSYDVTDKTAVNNILQEELQQTKQVICAIREKRCEFIKKDKKALWLCKNARYYYNKARKTKHLRVSESCIGCGLCQKNCPTKAIQMGKGKPIWVKDKCTMCFGCLHKCPAFAISYDDKTQKNGQYTHP